MMTQQSQQGVPATQPFTVTLEAQTWNAVMMAMGKAPYEIVAPLIQMIAQQLQTAAGTAGPLPNGQDRIELPQPN